MPKCPNCQTTASPDARFCASCGARLGDADGDADGDTTPVLTKPNLALEGDEPTDPNMLAVDPTLPLGPDLVTCTRCGAPNVPKRRLCGRCGADLHAGERQTSAEPVEERRPKPEPAEPATSSGSEAGSTPRLGPPAAVNPPVRTSPRFEDIVSDDSTEFEATHHGQRRPWLLTSIIVVGLGLGALLGVLLVTGIGPFGGDGAPTFVFDEARYEGAVLPLAPTRVGASTVLTGDALNSYGPSRLVDDDRSTAWRSLPDTDDAIVLDLTYDSPVWITEIAIATGDQASLETFEAVGRPTALLVTFDGTRPVRVALQDRVGVQTVTLDVRRLTAQVRFEIEEQAGVEGAGVAISEITLTGYPADDRDASAWRDAYG